MLRINYSEESLQKLDEIIEKIGLKMDDKLKAIDELLEDEVIMEEFYQKASKRYLKTKIKGRKGTPIVCILRLLIVKHLYGFSFEETEKFVSESLILRKFCRIGFERVCDDTTLIRFSHLLTDELLKVINHRLVEIEKAKRVKRGRKMRVDTTCVEANIHYPTDSLLVCDCIKKVSRIFKRVKELGIAKGKIVQDMTRTAKKLTKDIYSTAKSKVKDIV